MKTTHGPRTKPRKEPLASGDVAPDSAPDDERDDDIDIRVTRLNLRFVAMLLVGAAVLAVSLLLVHSYQTSRNAEVFRERAHAALEQGEFTKAISLLGKYVGLRPRDIEAQIELGDLLSEHATSAQQLLRAFRTYEGVLAQEPDRHDVRRRHIDVAMRLQRHSDAITHLAELVEPARAAGGTQPSPTDEKTADAGPNGPGSLPDLLILAGDCHYALQKMREATGLYLQGLALAPESIDGYRGLASALHVGSEPLVREDLAGLAPPAFKLDFATAPEPVRQRWSELQSLFPSREDAVAASPKLVENVLARMVELGRPAEKAYLMRARFRIQVLSEADAFSIDARRENRRAQLKAAAEDLDVALRKSSDDPEILLTSAQLALTRADDLREEGEPHGDQVAAARRAAERGMEKAPSDLRFFRLLADVELATENEPRERLQRAEQHLQSALDLVPEIAQETNPREQRGLANLAAEIRWQLADLLITSALLDSPPDEGALKRARQIVDGLEQNNARSPLVAFIAARLTMAERGDQPETWHQVARALHSIRPDLRSRDLIRRADLILGECYQRLANPDARISLYRQALAEDPLWVQGRSELASALAEQNRIDDALREYRLISGLPGVALQMARLIIVRDLSRTGGAEQPPQWEPVLRLLDQGERLAPEDVQFAVVRAQVLTLQKDYDRAQQLLEAALESHPDEPDVWAALVALELRREDREPEQRLRSAEELLARAGGKIGDCVELRLAAADLAIALGAGAVGALKELEESVEELSRDDQRLLLEGLARAHRRIENPKGAREIWYKLATENPHDLRYQLRAAAAAQDSADMEALRELLTRIREVEGAAGANGNVVEASLLINEAKEARATGAALRSSLARPRDLLQRAAQERPSWSAVPELLGHLEIALGNDAVALEHYERAISLGSRSEQVLERVVALLYEQKRYQDADRLLAGMARERPELISGNLARWQAEIAWQQEHFERAISVARDRSHASADPQDVIWRARLLIAWHYKLLAEGRADEAKPLVDEADKLYREAIEADRDSPTIWLAYVVHLARLTEISRAEAVIREAEEHLPDAPVYLAPLTLARCYEAIGNRQRAEEHFRKAAEAAAGETVVQMALADFLARGGDFAAAEREVREIIERPDAPEHDVAAARRQLAYLTGVRPGTDWTQARAALEMLAELQRTGEDETSADLRIKVAILARQKVQPARLQLIDALEELARRGNLKPQEQSQLLAAYLAVNRWPDARRMLERRIASEPANPQHYVDLITGLLQREGVTDSDTIAAENALARLQAIEPGSLRTHIARARLLVAQEQPAQAAELLVAYARNLEGRSTDEILETLQTEQDPEQLIDSVSQHLLLQPDASARRVLMDVRALKNEGKLDEAVSALREYLQARADFSEIVAGETIRYLALLLEEFRQPEAAEEVWRLYTARSSLPQAELLLAYFLARQRKYQEALDLCERSWDAVSADVAAEHHLGVLSSALRHGADVADRIPAVEERLRPLLDDDAASPRMLSVAAAFRDLQGRYDDAERLYWRVLRQNDRDVIALNNLAFMLGLRGQRLAEAEKLIDRAVELAGPVPELLDTRAIVRGARKKSSQAIADLKIAIEHAPSATKYFHLAQVHWTGGNQAAAREALAKAQKLGLNPSDLHPLQQPLYVQMNGRL